MNSRRDQDDQVERVNITNDKIDEKRAATIFSFLPNLPFPYNTL